MLNGLPVDYQEHIIWAVSVRAKQQDTELSRLALFLDPRFRQAARRGASAEAPPNFNGRLSVYAASQGCDELQIEGVLGQLSQYGQGVAPFNQAIASGISINGEFSAAAWWAAVADSNAWAKPLAELAIALHEVVPHAAAPERAFSTMGWYAGGKATRLAVETNKQKAAVKMHYDACKPKASHR